MHAPLTIFVIVLHGIGWVLCYFDLSFHMVVGSSGGLLSFKVDVFMHSCSVGVYNFLSSFFSLI